MCSLLLAWSLLLAYSSHGNPEIKKKGQSESIRCPKLKGEKKQEFINITGSEKTKLVEVKHY
jgi:hypothetical protein